MTWRWCCRTSSVGLATGEVGVGTSGPGCLLQAPACEKLPPLSVLFSMFFTRDGCTYWATCCFYGSSATTSRTASAISATHCSMSYADTLPRTGSHCANADLDGAAGGSVRRRGRRVGCLSRSVFPGRVWSSWPCCFSYRCGCRSGSSSAFGSSSNGHVRSAIAVSDAGAVAPSPT